MAEDTAATLDRQATGAADEDVRQQAVAMAEAIVPQLHPHIDARVAGQVDSQLRAQLEEFGLIEIDAEGQVSRPPVDPRGAHAGPFDTMGSQLRSIMQASMPGVDADPRLAQVNAMLGQVNAATGLSEGVPSDGGFLMQETYAGDIWRRTNEVGVVYPRITRRFTLTGNSNAIKMPGIDETSRANGSRWGGIQVFRVPEGETVTPTKPKFNRVAMELSKIMGLAYLTNEQLTDTPMLEQITREGFAEEIAFSLDEDAIRGSGVGAPLGVLESGALITVPAEAGQGSGTIEYQNVLNMWARMWARSRANAAWFINQDVEPALSTMNLVIGTGGVPVYLPPNGVSGLPYGTLFGRPVIPVEQCSTLGTVGDIILADFSQYWEIDKGLNPTYAVSMHVAFLTDEQAFRVTLRNDFRPLWLEAVTPYAGSNTLSPYIALATR